MASSSYKLFKSPSLLPLPTVMDRYIAAQLLPTFLFGVAAFSSIGVSVGIVIDLVRKVVESGLPTQIALHVLLLKLPLFFVYAFPMSTLLAALMTYSRLSSDSEIIALRSCGVSVLRLVLPAIAFSLVITGVTFLFNELVVPAANYQATLTLQQALENEGPAFQERNIFYPEYQEVERDGDDVKILSRLFYADEYDGERMRGLTIVDRSEAGLNQIVVAESAMWNPAQNTWDFFNGTIYLVSADSSYRNVLRFNHQQLQLPRTPLDLVESERDYGEMNIAQARERLATMRFSQNEQKVRKLRVRLQEKIAFPFVCVVFGFVGAVMGSKPQRTSRATSFGISVMVIFLYYLIQFTSSALGVASIISPIMAAWLPNLFGFAAGGLILLQASR